jgi:hypothetical protein
MSTEERNPASPPDWQLPPVSSRPDGMLPCRWWFGGMRSYGYLLAAELTG